MQPNEIYVPLARWKEYYKFPTQSGMRRRYEYRKTNGYDSAFIKDGGIIVVKVNEFFRCMEKRGEKK